MLNSKLIFLYSITILLISINFIEKKISKKILILNSTKYLNQDYFYIKFSEELLTKYERNIHKNW